MKRHVASIAGAVTLFVLWCPLPATATLADEWGKVQQALINPNAELLGSRVNDFLNSAREVDTRQLTPYAEALVAWAYEHPGEDRDVALTLAEKLDPGIASAAFLKSQTAWEAGSYLTATTGYVVGWFRLVTSHVNRRVLLSSSVLWMLLALSVSLLTVVVLQTFRNLRLLVHDAYELGLLLFKRANAVVFAAVVLMLPTIFAGLGPVWLLAYLWVMGWAYLTRGQRISSAAISLLLALVVPAFAMWQSLSLQTPAITDRVASMLRYRNADPSTVNDFAELEQSLESSAAYHLLLGELFRMHGDLQEADTQFRKAALIKPDEIDALIARANIAAENGDMNAAALIYDQAAEIDNRNALVHYNLAYALDQMNRFQEADQARRRAQALLPAGIRLSEIGVGGAIPRIRYPRLGKAEIQRMYREVSPEERRLLSQGSETLRPVRWLLNPLTAVFVITALLGGIALVLREKWMWTGQACAKCGKVFCPRCKSSSESASYCTQCISVFLKRDGVAKEQQRAKKSQIRRWQFVVAVAHRISAVIPGGGLILSGRVWRGVLLGFSAWLFLLGVTVWLPGFMPSMVSYASPIPMQIVFGLLFILVWCISMALSWNRG